MEPKYWVAYKERTFTTWKCRLFYRRGNAKTFLFKLIYQDASIQQIRNNIEGYPHEIMETL